MKESDWISVKDRFPELHCNVGYLKFSEEVLICVVGEVLSARLVCDKINNEMFWSALRGGLYDLEEGIYWQPIVLPKKEEL